MRLRDQRTVPNTIALTVAFLAACEPTTPAESAIDANPTKAREHVVGCYKDAYHAKQGTAPIVNANERGAAERLLSRYGGRSSRACEAVTQAMNHNVCGLPVSLESVAQCDQRQREIKAGSGGVTDNTKAQLTDRIKENTRRDVMPSGMSGY